MVKRPSDLDKRKSAQLTPGRADVIDLDSSDEEQSKRAKTATVDSVEPRTSIRQQLQPQGSKKKKHSCVWEFFNELDGGKFICRKDGCGYEMSRENTGNAVLHLAISNVSATVLFSL